MAGLLIGTELTGTFEGTLNSNTTFSGDAGQRTCKAWVNFNGGTVTDDVDMVGVRDSFNVSSVVDLGPGQYTVNWDNAFGDANYSVSACGVNLGYGGMYNFDSAGLAAASFQLKCFHNNTTGYADGAVVCVIAFGD